MRLTKTIRRALPWPVGRRRTRSGVPDAIYGAALRLAGRRCAP